MHCKYDCEATHELAQKQVQGVSQTCKSESKETHKLAKRNEMSQRFAKCDHKEVCDLQQEITFQQPLHITRSTAMLVVMSGDCNI